MGKFLKKNTVLICIAALFVIYNVIFWAIVAQNIQSHHAGTWVGYGFIVLGFVFCALITFIKIGHRNNETSAIPMYAASMFYLIASFVGNLIVIFVNSENITGSLVFNIILLMLYVIGLVIAYKSFSRVKDNTEKREQRMFDWRMMENKANMNVNLCEDPEIKEELKKLKEDISYSSSASNPSTIDLETQLSTQLDYIKSLLDNEANAEELKKAIKRAGVLLQSRNQMVMVARR